MKTKMEKVLTGLVIALAAVFLLWVGCFVASLFTVPYPYFGSTIDANGAFWYHLNAIADAFRVGFTSNWTYGHLRGYATLLVTAAAVAGIVLTIVFSVKKKKPMYALFSIAILFALLPALDLIGASTYVQSDLNKDLGYIVSYDYFLKNFNIDNGAKCGVIFYSGITGFGYASFVLVWVIFGLGLAHLIKGDSVQASMAPVPEASDNVLSEPFNEVEPEPISENLTLMEEEPAVDIPVVTQEAPVESTVAASFKEEPEVETEQKKEEPVPAPAPAAPEKKDDLLTTAALTALLKDVVRDIVRDEIARNNANQPKEEPVPQAPSSRNQSITGATFGGPLVVQYFNGGINGVTPAPAPNCVPAPAPVEPAPAPVVEQPAPAAPAPVENVAVAVNAPAPAVEPAPAPKPLFGGANAKKKSAGETKPVEAKPAAEGGKKPFERISFAERLLQSDKELQANYNEIKNEILSWGVKSRVSNAGDTFRLHTKTYIKLVVAGKSLKLYFALDPKDYQDSKMPVQDASGKGLYAEIPLVFKVKSGLSVRRCKELIQDCMEKDGLEQGEIASVNWIKELKAEMKSDKK